MHTRKASFRLLAIIICFATVPLLAMACGDPEPAPVKPPPVAQYLWPPAYRPCFIEMGMTTAQYMDKLTEEQRWMTTEDVIAQRPTREQMREVIDKHLDLLFDYPHARSVTAGDYMLSVVVSSRTIGYGITLYVIEYVDPDTVPEENRIPNCLDGVPVRIVQDSYPPYGAK